jgi:SAM-dependent methyltransferase
MSGPKIPSDRDLVAVDHPTGSDYNWLAKRQIGNALAMAAQKHAAGRLIDIGCGEKPYQTLLAPYVTEHIGVDHPDSPHALTGIDVLATAYDIPLPAQTFGTALLSEVLEHLERPDKALAEAYRLLTPGGWLIVTTPFIWVLHEMPRDFFRYSPSALEFLLTDAGFDSIEITPLGGQWTTISLLISYALRESPARWRAGNRGRHLARLAQHIGYRLDRRNWQPWMAWNHLAIARKPAEQPRTGGRERAT